MITLILRDRRAGNVGLVLFVFAASSCACSVGHVLIGVAQTCSRVRNPGRRADHNWVRAGQNPTPARPVVRPVPGAMVGICTLRMALPADRYMLIARCLRSPPGPEPIL